MSTIPINDMLFVTNLAIHCSYCQFIQVKLLLKRQATQDRQTMAICDTGSLMNSNRENIVLYKLLLTF